MKTISEEKFLKLVNEVSKESCDCHDGFCIFRTIIEHQHFDIRTLVQLQCILKFRYEESARHNYNIGKLAEMKWFESGLAEEFANVYSEELTFTEIYDRTVEYYNPLTGRVEHESNCD